MQAELSPPHNPRTATHSRSGSEAESGAHPSSSSMRRHALDPPRLRLRPHVPHARRLAGAEGGGVHEMHVGEILRERAGVVRSIEHIVVRTVSRAAKPEEEAKGQQDSGRTHEKKRSNPRGARSSNNQL